MVATAPIERLLAFKRERGWKNLPIYSSADSLPTGILKAGFVATTDHNAQDFHTLVCASNRPGQKRLWPPIFPTVSLLDCVPGKLDLSAFNPFGEIGFNVAGSAFLVRDGKPEYWKGPSLVIANPLIADLIHKSIIPAMLAWVGLSLKALCTRRRPRF